MTFKKAERKKAKLRLGISGISGSGKTWSALEIATGMGGKIAMIDTESGRGELYGEDFEYDVMQISVPYSVEKYIHAIRQSEQLGYDILIIDSLSHAWVGEGGVLSVVDNAGTNKFTSGWKVGTPKQNALVDAIISSKLHIIFTMRSKAEYVLETNSNGKQQPRKVGMAPVQREGLEYECTVYMDMSQEHIAFVSKDNTKLYKDNQYVKPTKEMGQKLIEWLNSGKSLEEIKAAEQEKEKFELSLMISAIKGAVDMEELKNKYESTVKHYRGNEAAVNDLIAAKEERKYELANGVQH